MSSWQESVEAEQVNPIIQDVRHALHLLDGHLHRFHPSPDADGEYDDSDERESIVTIERLLQSSLAVPQAAAGTASRETFARRLANYDGNDFDAKPGIAEHDKGKYRKRADDILAFLANNEFRKWRRNQLIGSPTEEPANKGAEMGTVPDQLTDAQIEAGVAALRQIRSKFKGDQTDQATVYAVFFAVLGTTS